MSRTSICLWVFLASLAACDSVVGVQSDPQRTVYVSHTAIVLAPGETMALQVLHDPDDELRHEIPADRWWSDDESVVRVDASGVVEAIGIGRTTVRLEASSQEDSARVAVRRIGAAPSQRWQSVAVGEMHACALSEAGRAYCWGLDGFGELGGGTRAWITRTLAPLPVVGVHLFRSLTAGGSVTCGLKDDGSAWCWGFLGLTGSGIEEDLRTRNHHVRAKPERVDLGAPISWISSSFLHTCLLDAEGRAYCWGENRWGQLGLGHFEIETPNRPLAVDTEVRFREIRPFSLSTCGLSIDGAAYCWGRNESGEAGTDEGVPGYSTPQEVAGGHRFRTFARTGVFTSACAITQEGRTFCWGMRGYALEGDGDGLRHAPAALAADPGFERLVTGGLTGGNVQCGLLEDGEVLCWGWDDPQGLLGTEDVRDTCREMSCNRVPTPIQGGLRFRELSVGPRVACGIATDGALYCWGDNRHAQLGTGRPAPATTSMPVRVVDPL
jgi:alpha-tubulin suppressor-like RCC1 family protein